MKKIVILTHEFDDFSRRDYLLNRLSQHWRHFGHDVSVVAGSKRLPDADIAILHVDLSVVPDTYLRALEKYPRVLNGRVADIRKRAISRNLLSQRHRWNGAVVVKTDLNHAGIPERLMARRSGAAGASNAPCPGDEPYSILSSIRAVNRQVWVDPTKVVERFLPERDHRGYWLRAWVFLGNAERCTRYLSRTPIVKGSAILDREPVEVPKALRAERRRLGFDYGKFDFVLHEGKPVLFDANRTPAGAPPGPGVDEANLRLAMGIDSFF